LRVLPFAVLALVALPIAAPAAAQETRTSAAAKFSREFKAGDANGDGAWSRSEVQARIGRMKLGAGKPDAERTKRLADLWFARADVNKNGKVTEPEAQALLAAVFRRYDVNGDGKVGGLKAVKPADGPAARPQGR
jgi:hypothetical protein